MNPKKTKLNTTKLNDFHNNIQAELFWCNRFKIFKDEDDIELQLLIILEEQFADIITANLENIYD